MYSDIAWLSFFVFKKTVGDGILASPYNVIKNKRKHPAVNAECLYFYIIFSRNATVFGSYVRS